MANIEVTQTTPTYVVVKQSGAADTQIMAAPVASNIDVDEVGPQGPAGTGFIKLVSPLEPDTASWQEGEIWADTENANVAIVLRVWTGTEFLPARE